MEDHIHIRGGRLKALNSFISDHRRWSYDDRRIFGTASQRRQLGVQTLECGIVQQPWRPFVAWEALWLETPLRSGIEEDDAGIQLRNETPIVKIPHRFVERVAVAFAIGDGGRYAAIVPRLVPNPLKGPEGCQTVGDYPAS